MINFEITKLGCLESKLFSSFSYCCYSFLKNPGKIRTIQGPLVLKILPKIRITSIRKITVVLIRRYCVYLAIKPNHLDLLLVTKFVNIHENLRLDEQFTTYI